MKFRNADRDPFEVWDFEPRRSDIVFLPQEIIVGPSSYPTQQIGRQRRAFRQGSASGYANLGALLMSDGLRVRLRPRSLGGGRRSPR